MSAAYRVTVVDPGQVRPREVVYRRTAEEAERVRAARAGNLHHRVTVDEVEAVRVVGGHVYVRCDARDVPAGGRWFAADITSGQTVQVEYLGYGASQAGPGAQYRRVTDRSDGSVGYYRLVEES